MPQIAHRQFAGRKWTRRATTLVALLVALTLAAAGCGSSSSSSQSSSSPAAQAPAGAQTTATTPKTHFAKTKFVLHAGLAFGAFHRYIYKPFKNGGFTPPSQHKLALVKGAVAALFAYHEVKLALFDAKSSPLLSKLVSPITALQTKLQSLGAKLRGGQVDPATINGANADTSTIGAQSAAKGQPITDQPTPSLGG